MYRGPHGEGLDAAVGLAAALEGPRAHPGDEVSARHGLAVVEDGVDALQELDVSLGVVGTGRR